MACVSASGVAFFVAIVINNYVGPVGVFLYCLFLVSVTWVAIITSDKPAS